MDGRVSPLVNGDEAKQHPIVEVYFEKLRVL